MNDAMTLPEIERHAYVTGNLDIVAVIHSGEENAEDSISFDHQCVIDDRNGLYDALSKCVEEMQHTLKSGGVDSEAYDLAIDKAETAMKNLGHDKEETLFARLTKAQDQIKELRRLNNDANHKLRRDRNLGYVASNLVRAFVGKHPPKWAAALSEALKEQA